MSNTDNQVEDTILEQLAEEYIYDVKMGNNFPLFAEQILVVNVDYNRLKWEGQIRDLILEIANAAYKEGFAYGQIDDKEFPEY